MTPSSGRHTVRWLILGIMMIAIVIVPFLLFEQPILHFTELAMKGQHRWVLATTVVVLLVADVVLPVPSSLVATGGAVLLGSAAGFAATWLGLTLGGILGYWLGATAGRAFASKIVSGPEVARAEELFARFGSFALVICRAVPVMAEVSVVFAGISRMRLRTFATVVAISNAGLSLAYVAVARYALDAQSFWIGLAGAIIVPVIASIAVRSVMARKLGG